MKSALMLGVNPNFKREKDDFYATDPKSLELVLPLLQNIGLCNSVWECACGQGHLSKVLEKYGFNVKSSDLIDRGFGEIKDFLECNDVFEGDILTNPPFKLAEQFVEKGLSLLRDGSKLILFLKIQFLESKIRKKLFEKYPPKYLLVNSERQKCAMNGDFQQYSKNSNTQLYCWYVWEKGYIGEPIIKWI